MPTIQEIQELIAKDEIDKALELTAELFKDQPKFWETVHLSGRYADTKRNIRMGTVSYEYATVDKNRIKFALIELLQEAEPQETGKRFNDNLVGALIPAIAPYSMAAKRILSQVESKNRKITDGGIIEKAKEILSYSFVGIVGVQLASLFAIGIEEGIPIDKQKRFLRKCVDICTYTLSLLNFTMLSVRWDLV